MSIRAPAVVSPLRSGGRTRSHEPVTSTTGLDVYDVFDRSRGGDEWATQVSEAALRALGGALAPWFTRFQANTVAFGGAMTGKAVASSSSRSLP
jgi:predicted NBD/HSP70 family sugar kinase